MFKKFMCLLMVVMCLSGLVACGGSKEKTPEFVKEVDALADEFVETYEIFSVKTSYDVKENLYMFEFEFDKEYIKELFLEGVEGISDERADQAVEDFIKEAESERETLEETAVLTSLKIRAGAFDSPFKIQIGYRTLSGELDVMDESEYRVINVEK